MLLMLLLLHAACALYRLPVEGQPAIQVEQPCISQAAPDAETSCGVLCQPQQAASTSSDHSFSSGDAPENCDAAEDDWTRGAVWRGGELLARELLAHPHHVRGARVLELGAGTGLVGLAAAAAGAASACLSDQTTTQMEAGLRLNPTLASQLRLAPLEWGNAAQLAAAEPPFDVAIAADVIYPQTTAALPALLATLRDASAPAGRALLAYVERESAVSERLEAELSSLVCRCRRRTLGRKAWLYMLDQWADAPRESQEQNATLGGACIEMHDE